MPLLGFLATFACQDGDVQFAQPSQYSSEKSDSYGFYMEKIRHNYRMGEGAFSPIPLTLQD